MKRLTPSFGLAFILWTATIAADAPEAIVRKDFSVDSDYSISTFHPQLVAPPNGQPDPDGSISNHANLGGYDYQNECGKQFSIQPNIVEAAQNTPVPVTFFVGQLGGPNVFDKGRLDYRTVVTDSAWNIQSGGFVSWWDGGPQTHFLVAGPQTDGTSQLLSNAAVGISQTLTSPGYATAGCYVLSAIMQGDFKHKSSTPNEDGSYRCVIQRAVVVQVPLPLTTIDCGATPGIWPDLAKLKAKYRYVANEGDDLHQVITTVYKSYFGAGFTAARKKKLYDQSAADNQAVINGHPGHLKRGAKLILPDPSKIP